MNKIKYISIEDLRKHVKQVVEDVYKYDTEYIVMVDKEPKVRISSLLDGKTAKETTVEDKARLEEFVK